MKTRQFIFLFSLIVIISSCNSLSETEISIEEEKVKNVFPEWIKAVSESQNAEVYFDYVTYDYISMESGSYPESDKERLLASVSGLIENYTIHLENWESKEVIIRNDIAIHRHSGILVLESKADTSKMKADLKYMDILKRDSKGNWKIYIHSNSPNR